MSNVDTGTSRLTLHIYCMYVLKRWIEGLLFHILFGVHGEIVAEMKTIDIGPISRQSTLHCYYYYCGSFLNPPLFIST